MNIFFYCVCVFFLNFFILFCFVLFVEPFKCTSFPLNVLWNWKADLNFNHVKKWSTTVAAAPFVQIKRIYVVWIGLVLWINYKDNSIFFLLKCTIFRMINSSQYKPMWSDVRNGKRVDMVVIANKFIKSASVMHIFIKL